MKPGVLVVALALLAAACSSVHPVAINTGDVCFSCKRPIADVSIASEAIGSNGLVMKFRTVSCMAKYMAEGQERMAAVYVTDHATGKLVRAETAMYVRAVIDPETLEQDYMAFQSVRDAVKQGEASHSSPIDWPTMVRFVTMDANKG